MRRTEALQGVRMAMFLNILHRWEWADLNQEAAAELLGVAERTFRRGTPSARHNQYDESCAQVPDPAKRQRAGPGPTRVKG